jgi:hypothetical protein
MPHSNRVAALSHSAKSLQSPIMINIPDVCRHILLIGRDYMTNDFTYVGLHLFHTGVTFRIGKAHVYYTYW